jgi:hypothetical protein
LAAAHLQGAGQTGATLIIGGLTWDNKKQAFVPERDATAIVGGSGMSAGAVGTVKIAPVKVQPIQLVI